MKLIKSAQKGFTLIELLVVITLIAILAVAVLAAINPIEQRKKAQDTGLISMAEQVLAAEERHFASYGCYSTDWDSTNGVCDTPTLGETYSPDLARLEDVGEIKPSFSARYGTTASGKVSYVIDAEGGMHAIVDVASKTFMDKASCDDTCSSCGTPDPSKTFCVPDSVGN